MLEKPLSVSESALGSRWQRGGDQAVSGGDHLALEVTRMRAKKPKSSRGESPLSWPGLSAKAHALFGCNLKILLA